MNFNKCKSPHCWLAFRCRFIWSARLYGTKWLIDTVDAGPIILKHASKAALKTPYNRRKCTCSLWSLDTCSSLSPSKWPDNLKQAEAVVVVAAAAAAAASHFCPAAAQPEAQAAYERLWQRPAHTHHTLIWLYGKHKPLIREGYFYVLCVKLRKVHQKPRKGEK